MFKIPASRFVIYIVLFTIGAMAWAVYFWGSGNWFDDYAKLGEAITGIIAVLAVVSFLVEQKRYKNTTVIDQVSFFRTEILEKSFYAIQVVIKKNKPDFDFSKLLTGNLKEFSILWLYEHKYNALNAQTNLISASPMIIDIMTILDLLNKMEEFSLRLVFNEIIDHKAFLSIKDSYVYIVESFAAIILDYRFKKESTYGGIKKVYMCWKNEVDREDPKKKIVRLQDEVRRRIREGNITDFWGVIGVLKKGIAKDK